MKISIVDFWDTPENILNNDYLFYLLKKNYKLELSDTPDVLFYSCFGEEHKNYNNCIKIYYTGENIKPNKSECDYSLSFDKNSKTNYYLPNYTRHPYFQDFINNNLPNDILQLQNNNKSKFCNFMYHNANAKERISFCKELMKYKQVDCPGDVLNNMPPIDKRGDWLSKIKFQSQYKFSIAFENEKAKGYTTEKIYHPLLAKSIPIYWGNPNIDRIFNPKAFINANKYWSYYKLIKRIKEIDNNDNLFQEIISQPPLLNNKLTKCLQEESILIFFQSILKKYITRSITQ